MDDLNDFNLNAPVRWQPGPAIQQAWANADANEAARTTQHAARLAQRQARQGQHEPEVQANPWQALLSGIGNMMGHGNDFHFHGGNPYMNAQASGLVPVGNMVGWNPAATQQAMQNYFGGGLPNPQLNPLNMGAAPGLDLSSLLRYGAQPSALVLNFGNGQGNYPLFA